MSLIAELQRRKVFKVAVAYGVVAWIFDRTLEGLKVESSAVGNKHMFSIAAVLAVVAIGGYWQSQSSLIYHDKLIRLQLGDDPRYQALMRQIETRFEKL